jgi:hypothetical protein
MSNAVPLGYATSFSQTSQAMMQQQMRVVRNWDAVIRTNLDCVFNMTKHVMDGMTDRGRGAINVSSVNDSKGTFGQTNYSAAKAGMHGFAKALALEVARRRHGLTRLHRHHDGHGHCQGGARLEDSSANSAWAPWGGRRDRRPDHLFLLGGGLRDRCKYRDQRRPAHAVTETLEASRSLRRHQMKAANLNSDDMLKTMVAEAVKQKQIRSTVRELALKALQARELGLSQINNVVRNVTQGVNAGLRNKGDVEKIVADAVAGTDDARPKALARRAGVS